MTNNNFNIEVGALLNTKNIPQQLKSLNADLVKSTATKIQIPVTVNTETGLQTLKNFIKEVNVYKDKLNNTFKEVKIIDPKTNKVWENQDKIVQVSNAIKVLTTETNKYQNALGQLVTKIKTVDSANNTLITETRQYVNEFGQQVTETRKLDENLKQLGETIVKINNFEKEVTTTTTQTKQVIQEAGKELEALVTTTEKVGSKGEYLKTVVTQYTDAEGYAIQKTEQFNEANQRVATTQTTKTKKLEDDTKATKDNTSATEQNAKAHQTLGQSLSNAFAQLARYYVASLPIQVFRKAVQETITTVKEFDSALIEFRKVSDLAGESLTEYVAKLAEMGEVTGSTMQAMVEAATEFRKSGFSDEDSAKLASIAEKYRNIADEEISAGESASFIIAQMKAFNIEAGQAEHIIDAVNEV